ncbi:right-handed parallel beta-helix repeat-containing protein [Methanosarcina sp.]|uniref:right-handed parallel beta-helix repeat-containing protein n=1 Tax=Methanosarcina sp. TaxID=2213 RepID=UPI002ABB7419|nr:NosD domain-containing protein [Methanosarcina sp.]MDY9927298.1 NosD domain-containing protein [Methanosarcina sp.]
MGINRVIILLAVAIFLIENAVYSPVSAKEIIVDDDFEVGFMSIQEAINSSSPGDTVIVKSGTYKENIIVNVTRLTIRSESGEHDVVVEPLDKNESIFLVKADNVTITGFSIKGAGETPNYPRGFIARNFTEAESINRGLATGNVPTSIAEEIFKTRGSEHYRPPCGISLENASNCIITENMLFENYRGIRFDNASDNTVSKNLFFNDGIAASEGSVTNNLTGNIIEKGYILLGPWASNNLITENKILNGTGISFACCGGGDIVSYNTIINCSSGVDAYDRSIEIRNNTITDCFHGVDLSLSGGTGIYNNKISNCSIGVNLGDACPDIQISNNTITSSADCGIFIPDHEGDEQVYNNYFNNTINIKLRISDGNTWNNSLTSGTNIVGGPFIGGNFWANPDGKGFSQTSGDFDLDGICDSAYEIGGPENIDYLPLSRPPESVPITVGDDEPDADYDSIQKAVSAAPPSSTILVYPGTYVENVAVTVEGLKVYSRSIDPEEVTVQALNPEDNIFHVSANNVTICGLTVKGKGEESEEIAGIYIDSVYGCSLCNNTVSNNRNGIFLSSSNENTLRSNNVTENVFGIVLLSSSNNILVKNTLVKNILIKNSTEINRDSGIYPDLSDSSPPDNNTLINSSNNKTLINSSDNNTLINSSDNNTLINPSDNNTLINNTVYGTDSSFGSAVYLSGSISNILQDNEIRANSYGIMMETSENNTITRNNLRENTACGVLLSDSNGNRLYDNYFNNTIDVKMEKSEINHWNINRSRGTNFIEGPYLGGNFWAKPDGSGFSENAKDSDIDGISDSAYIIESTGITDSFPLTRDPEPVLLIENGVPVKDFSRIQDAVDSAIPGSTIVVYPGTYKENIIVDKENISIVSESGDPGNTIIKTSNTTEDVINVTSKGVKISGFHIAGPEPGYTGERKAGICLYNTSENTIDSNVFSKHLYAIYMVSSDSNNVINNAMEKNERGLYLEDSERNSITNNMVLNNIEGAVLNQSGNNSLLNNTISLNKYQGIYIYSFYSDEHDSAGSNLIKDNLISGNDYGIYTSFSENNTVWNNIINLNSMGILLSYSSNNLLRDNLIESSRDFGLYMYSGSNNTFYNNLFNNTLNLDLAYGNKNTSWNITKTSGTNIVGEPYSGGNFWAKPDGTGFSQNCTDLDNDGICDYPYEVNESEFDYLPLALSHTGCKNGCNVSSTCLFD